MTHIVIKGKYHGHLGHMYICGMFAHTYMTGRGEF